MTFRDRSYRSVMSGRRSRPRTTPHGRMHWTILWDPIFLMRHQPRKARLSLLKDRKSRSEPRPDCV